MLLGSWIQRALDDDLSRSGEPFAYDPMIFVDTSARENPANVGLKIGKKYILHFGKNSEYASLDT